MNPGPAGTSVEALMTVIHVWADIPRTGLWCPKCLLPSGVEVPLYSVSITGVSVWPPYRFCYDCGTRL